MKRILGKSKIEVSAMGIGCWAIGGPFQRTADSQEFYPMGWGKVDDNESIQAIHAAMDLGITFIDTSNNYGAGHSEIVIGKALQGRRDKVILSTKFGSVFDEIEKIHYDQDENFIVAPEFIRKSCEESLHRLQTDYIDLYQFHVGIYDETCALDVRNTLDELVFEGNIRAFGWSTDRPNLAGTFAESDNCIAIQHRLNVLTPADEMLSLCADLNLASINRSPLNSALLTGKFHDGYMFSEDDGRMGFDWKSELMQKRLARIDALRDVLTSNGRTMAQGALAWIWARSNVTIPIPGFKTVAQIEENAKAMDFGPLTESQMNQINTILNL